MMTALDYYAAHSPITAPVNAAPLLDGLPASVAELRCVVQGLVLHVFWAERYGVRLAPERQEELQLRWVARQLARIIELDPRPLAEARPSAGSSVTAATSRCCSRPCCASRARPPAPAAALATISCPIIYEDHWVCEYWNTGQHRWVLVDAQLDALQCQQLSIGVDPLDVPRDQFIVGGQAWQLCRAGQADPETFGIANMHGLWFVRGDFVRDVGALNKIELLPWDVWGIMERPDAELQIGDYALLDHLANLPCGDVPDFDEVRRLYNADSRLRVPRVIHSYLKDGPKEVEVGEP